MIGYLYIFCLFLTCWIALRFGDREEQVASAFLAIAGLGTLAIYLFAGRSFERFGAAFALSDGLLLVVALYIAYRSRRFWPLIFASFQIAATLSQFVPLLGVNLVAYAIGVTQGFWGWLQMAVLILASVRGHNRARLRPTSVRFLPI